MRRITLVLALAGAAALALTGCDDFVLEIRVGLRVAPDSVELMPGDTAAVEADVTSTNVDRVDVSWRSRDPGVAEVSVRAGARSAVVTALSPGRTTVLATATGDGADPARDSVRVAVRSPP